MKRKYKYALYVLLGIAISVAIALYLFSIDIAVLNPKGMIAEKQKELFLIATWWMVVIVVPVFILTAYISIKYKEGNKTKHSPDWDNSHLMEVIWWGFPCIIVIILSIMTWKSCHALDPFKPLDGDKKPLKIEVVALQWKWLFIYPEQNIAMVNFFQIPAKTPIDFHITSDAPMNSFWLPQLGGQVYAMAGMRSKLHLIANEEGEYRGCSANLSGEGFAGMTFVAKASSEADFQAWVGSIQASSHHLGLDEYNQLLVPSSYVPVMPYVLEKNDLFDSIVMKYMQEIR